MATAGYLQAMVVPTMIDPDPWCQNDIRESDDCWVPIPARRGPRIQRQLCSVSRHWPWPQYFHNRPNRCRQDLIFHLKSLPDLPLPSASVYHGFMLNRWRHFHRDLPPHYVAPMMGARPSFEGNAGKQSLLAGSRLGPPPAPPVRLQGLR